MMKRDVCKVLVWMACMEVVCCKLPSQQVSAITSVFHIIQNHTGCSFGTKNSNPCLWEGVFCNPDYSSIINVSFPFFEVRISTSEFLPFLCNITTLESVDVSWNSLNSIPDGFLSGCGNMSGLKHLDFSYNNLHGPLPSLNGFKMLEYLDFSRNSLSGEISVELDGLVSLKSLDLSHNQFTGRIPTNLGKLNLMEELVLHGNSLTGSIPGELGELTRLQTLDLSFNQLSGAIPTWISNITTLREFEASFNQLNGRIPSDLLSGPYLEYLDLSNNELEGPIPAINSTRLSQLYLGSNNLNGTIPWDSLGTLLTFPLKVLNLSDNQFRGRIPRNVGKLNLMEELLLDGNSLRGSIPGELGELTRLQTLDLSNNQLSGAIPTWISNITTLRVFRADVNHLNGSIPSGITSHLTFFSVDNNKLTGSIPSDLLSGPNLEYLDLSNNELEGSIPAINSTTLSVLDLSYNDLNGTIPWDSLGTLLTLELSHNRLTGTLPPVLGNLTNLQCLWLDSNDFVGAIPPEISHLNLLTYLDISANSLNGSIPSSISMMQRLTDLKLEGNNLQGPMPDSIRNLSFLMDLHLGNNLLSGRIPDMPESLQFALNLSFNLFHGKIPDSLSRLVSLEVLDLQANNLHGPIPNTIRRLSSLTQLQLANNQLTTPIPHMPETMQIALNLSYNLFSGPIPDALSNLWQLGVLDLSNNRFSGQIPDFLTQFSGLNHLLLMNNNLSGVVPSFRNDVQVDTWGNPNLIDPRQNPTPALPHRKKNSIHPHFFIAAATGFPVGVLISIIAIFISRRYHTIHGILSTPNTIHKPIIHFNKAMQAVSDPSNITVKATFSTFYKAVMPSGTTYLVKKFNHTNKIFQFPRHKELVEELEVLGELSNPNVMIPVAYLLTTRTAYLFYDFVRGTLYDILHHRMGCRLDWPSRFTIAVGVSKGLAFLHECTSGPIILLDLCSKSILLKSMDVPQISDIELCSLIHPSKTRESMAALGASSVGYVPPEYGSTKRVTAAGNVYSFGVVLLELVTGKPAVSEGSELAKWVLSISEQGDRWDEILDSSVSETSVGVRNQMVAVVKVGLACINTSPEMRPNSATVLQMLQNRL